MDERMDSSLSDEHDVCNESIDEMIDDLYVSEESPSSDDWAEKVLAEHGTSKDVDLHSLFIVDGFVSTGTGLGRHCRYIVGRISDSSEAKPYSRTRMQSVVYRRFADFCLLYQHLVDQMPLALVPMHPDKTSPIHLRAFSSLTSGGFRQQRAEWCHAFLGAVLRRKCLVKSEWVRHFLFDATEEWQVRLDFYAAQAQERFLTQAKDKALKLQSAFVEIPAWLPIGATNREVSSSFELSSRPNALKSSFDETRLSSTNERTEIRSASLPHQWGSPLGQLREWWNSSASKDSAYSSSVIKLPSCWAGKYNDYWGTGGEAFCKGEQQFEPEWSLLKAAHSELCCSPGPVEVYASVPFVNYKSWHILDGRLAGLGGSRTQQNVHVKIDNHASRSEALSLVANGLVFTLKRMHELGVCVTGYAEAAVAMAQDEPDSYEVNRFVSTLRSALQTDHHLLETIQSRHEKEAVSSLILRSSLATEGAHATFLRCIRERAGAMRVVAGSSTSQNSKSMSPEKSNSGQADGTMNSNDSIDCVSDLRDIFRSLASDFQIAREEVVTDLSTAVIRMVHANIDRAVENQRVFRELLDEIAASDGALSARVESNNARLGISSDAFIWNSSP